MLANPHLGKGFLARLDCIVLLDGVAVKSGAAVSFPLDGQDAKRYPPSKCSKG